MNELMKLNQKTMTSMEIAEITGKQHCHIIRDIKDEIEKLNNGFIDTKSKFGLSERKDSTGRTIPYYELTQEGVLQLAARYDAVVRAKLINLAMQQQKQLTPIEMIAAIATQMAEDERKISELESKVTHLENTIDAMNPDFYTVKAYANLHGKLVNDTLAKKIGKEASKRCKLENIAPDKVKDHRWGNVGSYPERILDDVFKNNGL